MAAEKAERTLAQASENERRSRAFRQAVEATVTYAVGAMVLEARLSFGSALALPWRLWRLHRDQRGGKPGLAQKPALRALQHGIRGRPAAAIARRLDQSIGAPVRVAQTLLEVSNLIAPLDPAASVAMAREAQARDAGPATQARLAFALHRAGALTEPAALLQKPGVMERLTPDSRIKAGLVLDEAGMLRDGLPPPPRRARALTGDAPPGVLYVSHLSAPHHGSGYAVRTHAILRSLQAAGMAVTCVTRPGYPWDRSDAREMASAAEQTVIDGVPYRRHRAPAITGLQPSAYALAAADRLRADIAATAPTVVVAGSNHVNALPALIAARHAGLPFFYDVRGLWEFTTAAKSPGWEHTDRFALSRRLETLVATEADRVFAISGPVRDVLIDRGVNPDRIALAPNGVDPEAFVTQEGREDIRAALGVSHETVVFGFIGTLEHYEGLDLLAEAFARLVRDGMDVALLVVGDGPYARPLFETLAHCGVIDRAHLVGRKPFADIARWYAAADVFVYPRRDLPLCRLVPPLKPLEAMAAGKPVIVADLPPLVELTGAAQSQSGVVIAPPDDVVGLAAAMAALARDPEARRLIGAQSRAWVRSARVWASTTSPLLEAIRAGDYAFGEQSQP